MQINGTIEAIMDTVQVSDKFRKREFVIVTDHAEYPQTILFECQQDKCSLLDKYSEGQKVSVDFNINGRKWNGPNGVKYFVTLQAWKIEAVNQ